MAKRCESCPAMKRIGEIIGRECAACDCGSHHGHSHVAATDYALSQRIATERAADDATVTNLSPDDEDALRKAMASLFSLDPVRLMFIQYAVTHPGERAGSQFLRHLKAVGRRIGRYRASSARATACAMRASLVRDWPMIAAVVAPLTRRTETGLGARL